MNLPISHIVSKEKWYLLDISKKKTNQNNLRIADTCVCFLTQPQHLKIYK